MHCNARAVDAASGVHAGACFELLSFHLNLGHFSNAVTLWLGMHPPFLFFQAFLPPLLLDSAVRIDFFLFRKVCVREMAGSGCSHMLIAALLVLLSCNHRQQVCV